jgi:hypothetical protein
MNDEGEGRSSKPSCGPSAEFPTASVRSGQRLPLPGAVVVLLLLLSIGSGDGRARGKQKLKGRTFKYAAGTENVPKGSTCSLELASESLTFKCFQSVVAVPYSSIKLMQYRSDVSQEVRRLKLKWHVMPARRRGKRNRYFTIEYGEGGQTQVIVFEVLPEVMQPYLAAIDLKAGKRVEVQGYENYE